MQRAKLPKDNPANVRAKEVMCKSFAFAKHLPASNHGALDKRVNSQPSSVVARSLSKKLTGGIQEGFQRAHPSGTPNCCSAKGLARKC